MWGGGKGEVKVVSVGPRGQQIAGWPAAKTGFFFILYSINLHSLFYVRQIY